MSSTRSKLVLDEQSFQGLLAAAFTIQQHNERQRASGSNSSGKEDPLKQTAAVCRQCGVPFPAGCTQCPSCDGASFRPGERLQRTWASMWLLSQEKILGPEDREKFAPAPPFPSKAIADGHDAGGHPPGAGALLAQPAIADLIPEARIEAADTLAASRALSPQNEPAVSGPPLHQATPIDDRAGVLPVLAGRESDDPRGDDLQMEIPAIDNLTVDDSPPPAGSASTRAIPRSFLDLQVKLRFHRADLYLGIAVLVAFLALLFPATATQRPRLRPWERMLIAMGIAEAPQPSAVHHAGDPNIKVWVDTHTALYYCPGTELYGKSPDGHYSTQREAQLDRFEPAERVVCVE